MGVGLGRRSSLPWAWFWGFSPALFTPTKRGAELPAHTSGKPHSICCGMSNKDEEINKQGGIQSSSGTWGHCSVKTGARGLNRMIITEVMAPQVPDINDKTWERLRELRI